MKIEYIFIRFLHFMSYQSFDKKKKKLSFGLVKKKSFFKSEEKTFWNDFFFCCFDNMSYF
jgi:hypothetical protein